MCMCSVLVYEYVYERIIVSIGIDDMHTHKPCSIHITYYIHTKNYILQVNCVMCTSPSVGV